MRVHYTGRLIDGNVFANSVQRGQPAEFPVSGIIPGWIEALTLMPVGSKWELYNSPHNLAYGERPGVWRTWCRCIHSAVQRTFLKSNYWKSSNAGAVGVE